MKRKGSLARLLSVGFPFLLPLAVLVVWMVTQSRGQLNEPAHILASIDPSGDGTAYLSTILPDGAQAVWSCSSGTFLESGDQNARGRSVTWKASPGFTDSVTVRVNTPSASDSLRFLPAIRQVTPSITVSCAYHLAILDRSRSVSLPAGSYRILALDEGLSGYDGLTVLLNHTPGGVRQGWVLFPGDTLALDLPLGGHFEAVGLDRLEDALDNAGALLIRFDRVGGLLPEVPLLEGLPPDGVPGQRDSGEDPLPEGYQESPLAPDV